MAVYFTKKGYMKQQNLVEQYKKELKNLTGQIDEMIDIGGDCWHDNAGYEDLRERIRMADARLREASAILNEAQVIECISNPDEVRIGTRVSILLDDEEQKKYAITAYGEGDPEKGKITYLSPLACSMLGKQVGDYYTCQLGGKTRTIEILDIEPVHSEVRPEMNTSCLEITFNNHTAKGNNTTPA